MVGGGDAWSGGEMVDGRWRVDGWKKVAMMRSLSGTEWLGGGLEVVVDEVCVVGELAGEEDLCDEEGAADEDAEEADDNVCGSQKGVFPAHPRGGGDDDSLCPAKGLDVEARLDGKGVCPCGEAAGDDAVELAEGGEACGAHPDDKVLVGKVDEGVAEARGGGCGVLELFLDVCLPRDPLLDPGDGSTACGSEGEGVVKVRPCDEAAGEVPLVGVSLGGVVVRAIRGR